MITQQEKDELAQRSRQDGLRLFKVAEGIYKFLITMNWITCIAGVAAAIVAFAMSDGSSFGVSSGLMILLLTIFACIVNYVVAVLSTHIAKVLVHLLFTNVAIMEGQGGSR